MTPHRIVDPTGVGDAFRGGLMKGMARGKSFKECAQLGSVAATYALEHLGGQSHAYTMKEFGDRYAGALRRAVAIVNRSLDPAGTSPEVDTASWSRCYCVGTDPEGYLLE